MRDPEVKRGEVMFRDGGSQVDLSGYNGQELRSAENKGYSVPEDQFAYDTTYHGPHH